MEASLTWFEVDAASADELEAICLEGYLDVLRDAGWAGLRKDVEFGYLASLALRSALGAATAIVTIIRNDTLHPWVEQAFGKPMDQIIKNLRSTMDFLEPRIVQMRRLLDSSLISRSVRHT